LGYGPIPLKNTANHGARPAMQALECRYQTPLWQPSSLHA
jgi:hypothetical protein